MDWSNVWPVAKKSETTPSKGSVALRRFVHERGSAVKLADSLGIGADRISEWSRGLCKPDIDGRKALLGLGIGIFDWDEPAPDSEHATGPEAA